ncbi:MAG: hypothetical protein RL477_395 [Pseudomonadota bacterium]|jgi:flagellar basal body rod protein FlgC
MSSIGTIAAQALAYQATVMATAAQNIVNARVGAPATAAGEILGAVYQPKTVAGVTTAEGGVSAKLLPVTPATHLVFDGTSPTGYSAMPNVDLGNEMATLMMASSSYRAATRLVAVESALSTTLRQLLA